MSNYEKEYIECRLILLGDEKVGKKSFISRLLNIHSTSTIRNNDIEMAYKKEILRLRRKYEKRKKYFEMLQEINDEITKSDMRNKKEEKTKSTISIFNSKSNSKSPEKRIQRKNDDNNNFILQITNEELFYSKDYIRPPIPEHPSKLFNIHKSKICVKPYFILPAEKVNYDYNPNEDESDNELDNDLNLSFKGIKKDISKIINNKKTIIEEDKLYGYRTSIYNIFLFLYDMSDFNSFEILKHYYDLIEGVFNISSLYNSICCVIANKKDIKVSFDSEQKNSLNNFIKNNNLSLYEISTKPFFNFDNFFLDFLFKNLNENHEQLFNEYNFKIDFEKIVTNKPTFSKSERETYPQKDSSPGPDYNMNIYSFNSSKELTESLNNKKFRFNKKIFYNKTGPKFVTSKSTKDINSNNNLLKQQDNNFQAKGGLLEKPIEGFTFGILKGKLNLLKERKDLFSKINENLKESIEGDSSLFVKNLNTSRVRGDEYIEEAKERKNKLFERRISEKKKIIEKLSQIHSSNLKKIKKEKNKKKKLIILSHNNKSLSSSDILSTNRNRNFDINIDEIIDNNKKRFLEVVYPKNKNDLEDYNKILKKINRNKKEYSTPGPNAYDIRNNYTDINKGPTILGKRKEILLSRIDPSFPNFKDEFDIIAEKANNNYIKDFKPRFVEIKKEENHRPYIDEEIWKKWDENKLHNEKSGRIKIFLQELKRKKIDQLIKMEDIKNKKEEIKKLRKEILIRKGYEDPNGMKSINYSLVEESSPKYSLKGRYSSVFTNDKNDMSNIFPGNTEMMELIKKSQLNRPLPNANIVKPRLPSIIFNKAERFDQKKKEYEGSMDLFKDGNFGIKTQENFSTKEPYSHRGNRESIYQKTQKSPSPADYKIKSSFEIIAEKGKKISDIRDKIKMKESLRKINIIEAEKELNLNLNDDNTNDNNNNKLSMEKNKDN